MATPRSTSSGTLKERIAALQELNASPPPSNGPSRATSPVGQAAPANAPGSLRDKIARFEARGGTPVPRGSFGSSVPPPETTGASKKRGELYGNRVPGLGRPHHNPTLNRNTSGDGLSPPSANVNRRVASDSGLADSVTSPLSPSVSLPADMAATGEPSSSARQSSLDALPESATLMAPSISAPEMSVAGQAAEAGHLVVEGDGARADSPASTKTVHAEHSSSTPPNSSPSVSSPSSPPPVTPTIVTSTPSATSPRVASPSPVTPTIVTIVDDSPTSPQVASPQITSPLLSPVTNAPSRTPSLNAGSSAPTRRSRPTSTIIVPPSPQMVIPSIGLPPTPDTAATDGGAFDAEIITPVRISPPTAVATIVPINRASSPMARSATAPAVSQPTIPAISKPTPAEDAPRRSQSSFRAVVHRKTTEQPALPSTPPRPVTYHSMLSSRPADPPSPAPGGDLAALLADAAFLEQALEMGGFDSPKKQDLFAAPSGLAGTLGASDKQHGRNLSVQTIKADDAGQPFPSPTSPPPQTPPKNAMPRLMSGIRSLSGLGRAGGDPRRSVASDMTSDDSAGVKTPATNSYEEQGVMVSPPRDRSFRDDVSYTSHQSGSSSAWSIKSKSSGRMKSLGRMFSTKSRNRASSAISEDRATSPVPSIQALEFEPSASQSLTPEPRYDHSRRESWMSSSSRTFSDLSSPSFDQELFDSFPAVPSSGDFRSSLALDTNFGPALALDASLPTPKYEGSTLLSPPSRSSSLIAAPNKSRHQKGATSPL